MTQRIGTPETLPLDRLQTFHKNPRRGNVPAIAESLRKNGQFRPIVVNRGTHTGREWEVLAGNHTLLAARDLQGTPSELEELDCYVVDVDDKEAERIVLADNRTADLGDYDYTALLDLLEGLDNVEGTGYVEKDIAEITALLEEQNGGESPEDELDKYTSKVNIPQYEPTGPCPSVDELYDPKKTEKLIARIESTDAPREVKNFLIQAAQRHTVIDFHKVANFYAHQEAPIQELMEEQALVIVDIKDAIRNGYATLSDRLDSLLDEEYGWENEER